MRPSPTDLFASARYYLYALDLDAGRADVLDVDRSFYSAPFLDQRALAGKRLGGWHYSLDELLDAHARLTSIPATEQVAPGLRWIFHVGHCGSTLLSRLLDQLPDVLGIREPLPLLALAEASLRRADSAARVAPLRVDAALAMTADLLARGFAAPDRMVVKATSTVSMLAPALLASRVTDRAVLLELPLPRYLAAYLRDPALRLQARSDAAPRLSARHEWTRDDTLALEHLDDAQCIALTWLVETERFARVAKDPAIATRVLRIDGDELVAHPAECLARAAQHLDLDASADAITHAIAGDVLHRYAKQPGRTYDAGMRERDLAQAGERFAREIRTATAWLRALEAKLEGGTCAPAARGME